MYRFFFFFTLDGSCEQLCVVDCPEMLLCLEDTFTCTYVNKSQLIVITCLNIFLLMNTLFTYIILKAFRREVDVSREEDQQAPEKTPIICGLDSGGRVHILHNARTGL